MGLPGVTVNVLDGNLALSPATNSHTPLLLGPCTAGTPNTLYNFADANTLANTLGFGQLVELGANVLNNGGGPIQVMPMTPSVQGGVSGVSHLGTGAGTLALTMAPHVSITIACTTAGTLGTAAFTFQLGTGPISAPVVSASGWSSTGYLVPGTYCVVVFTAGTYAATATQDTYTISTAGVIAHATGSGPAVPTITAGAIDNYMATITIVAGGALGTMSFTYSLDGVVTSSTILSVGGGVYVIPNTGVVLTFASTFVAADTYTFTTAGQTFATGDLTTAISALETTYLTSIASNVFAIMGQLSSAANWATQCATLETAAVNLFGNGLYIRWMNQCPSVGSITASGGSVVVDVADTDAAIISARNGVSAPHVAAGAGDMVMLGSFTNLSLRRNAMWSAIIRAANVQASQNLGYVGLGGNPDVISLYRDETKTPALDAAGMTTMRTFPGLPGFYITDCHTMTLTTSDYYPFTNARVIDLACGITHTAALPLVNSQIPTYTNRAGQVGVITEVKAQQIEGRLDGILNSQLVQVTPPNAVAAEAVVNRTNNIITSQNLIIGVAVQPFGYARTVTVNIGLAVSA